MRLDDDRIIEPDRLSLWLMRHWGSIGYAAAFCAAGLLLLVDAMIVLLSTVLMILVGMGSGFPSGPQVVMVAWVVGTYLFIAGGGVLFAEGIRNRRPWVVTLSLAVMAVPIVAIFVAICPDYEGPLGLVPLPAPVGG